MHNGAWTLSSPTPLSQKVRTYKIVNAIPSVKADRDGERGLEKLKYSNNEKFERLNYAREKDRQTDGGRERERGRGKGEELL